MSVSHTPAPARSDLSPAPATTARAARPFVLHGRMLSIGAVAWAAGMVVAGLDPRTTGDVVVFGLASGLFQVGLLFLLRVLWRTRALGAGRVARTALRLETGLLGLAIASTLADAVQVSDLGQPAWAMLDAFWPLSMLGMFLIGVRVAIAGKWTGPSRFWPMVAESWAVVVLPVMGVFGMAVGQVVAPLHLLVGYTVLGVLVARKQG